MIIKFYIKNQQKYGIMQDKLRMKEYGFLLMSKSKWYERTFRGGTQCVKCSCDLDGKTEGIEMLSENNGLRLIFHTIRFIGGGD